MWLHPAEQIGNTVRKNTHNNVRMIVKLSASLVLGEMYLFTWSTSAVILLHIMTVQKKNTEGLKEFRTAAEAVGVFKYTTCASVQKRNGKSTMWSNCEPYMSISGHDWETLRRFLAFSTLKLKLGVQLPNFKESRCDVPPLWHQSVWHPSRPVVLTPLVVSHCLSLSLSISHTFCFSL